MAMEEVARVYAEALFGAAKDKDKLDPIHEQLGEFADALADNRDMQLFFFSPYFSSAEKRDALAKTVDDTLAWHLTRPAEEQAKLKAGIAPEKEAEVLAAWKARKA